MATILIVEDHAMSRQILVTLLEYAGHRVLEASEGEKALALARIEHPDLIISDILLPAMDGREFVRRLRTEAVQDDTPVIFYTAWCRHPEDVKLDEILKPCHVLPKPSEPQAILRMVDKLLGEPSEVWYPKLKLGLFSHGGENNGFSTHIELQLSVLMDLSYSMVAERDPERLLNTFCRAVCEMINCQQSLLAIQGENGIVSYHRGPADKQGENSCPGHMVPPEDLLEIVASRKKPVLWGETMMTVPFASPTHYYGWVSVMGKPETGRPSKRDEEIVVTLSTQAALAYENILLVDQLKQSNETKEMFITNISHEFRTPLNILLSNAQLLSLYLQGDDELDKGKLKKKIDMQIRNCNRLIRLINNFIDISKIESSHFELNPVKCNIVEIVEAIAVSTAEYAGTKGINLVFDTSQEEIILYCDLDCIERIILNLISNAIKFTHRGGSIYVNLYKHGDCVRISVKDTGIGIPDDKIDLVFERFRQLDNLMTRKNEGSGIGLTLVKMLAEMHGGRVYVQSQYCKGSEFVVELPVNLTGKESAVSDTSANQSREEIIQRIKLEFSDIYF